MAPETGKGQTTVKSYRFLTCWQFDAPIQQVWEAITDVARYPEWWPGIRRADIVRGRREGHEGQIVSFAVRGALPYTLHFLSEAVESAPPNRMVVRATGDLVGRGEWNLTPTATGTEVTYLWEVRLDKPGFALLTRLPGVRRALERNHDRVMAQGGANLARRLRDRGG
jgi:uncharacterized protein YndB with AHSA1/START domain